MKKKKILIAYNYMMIGGSTTSLLSILNEIDYEKYEVDLICLDNKGELYDLIPVGVSNRYVAFNSHGRLRKILNIRVLFFALISRMLAMLLSVKYSYGAVKAQIINRETARISQKIEKTYDIAIAFIETWATEYVKTYVKADRKIAWFHLDYKGAKFCPVLDAHTYDHFNKIVLVSEKCKQNFDEIFPQYKDKTICVENILTSKYVIQRANEFKQNDWILKKGIIHIVTTCRIDFLHKGLDRAVRMLRKAFDEVSSPDVELKWHIFGDGKDLSQLQMMIKKLGLEKDVFVYGAKENPLPWVKDADLYFLPSRYEGKPMAVTEAQLLGVPALVTKYASADEQIANKKDGVIVDNSDEGILRGIIMLLKGELDVNSLKQNVKMRDYSNFDELEKIYELLEK